MKALSVVQPYASLIVLGFKRYETRSWGTGHRGRPCFRGRQDREQPSYLGRVPVTVLRLRCA